MALARRLLIDLWRFLEYGVVPEGALLTTDEGDEDVLVGEAARLSAGYPEGTVFRDWALHNQVPLSATRRMQHEVTDQRSARIELEGSLRTIA